MGRPLLRGQLDRHTHSGIPVDNTRHSRPALHVMFWHFSALCSAGGTFVVVNVQVSWKTKRRKNFYFLSLMCYIHSMFIYHLKLWVFFKEKLKIWKLYVNTDCGMNKFKVLLKKWGKDVFTRSCRDRYLKQRLKKIIVFLHRKNFCTSCIFEKISYVTQFPTITFFSDYRALCRLSSLISRE